MAFLFLRKSIINPIKKFIDIVIGNPHKTIYLYNGECLSVKYTLVALIYKSLENGILISSSISIISAICIIIVNIFFLLIPLWIIFLPINIQLITTK